MAYHWFDDSILPPWLCATHSINVFSCQYLFTSSSDFNTDRNFNRVCEQSFHTKHADVTWHGLKSRKAHENQMLSSSLGCNGLQPVQHLLKSLSWVATDFQYCNWLRCRGNDFIHSEKWFHFHEAHCARHIPGRGRNINLLIHGDIKSLQGRILKMLSFCFKGPNTDLQIWKYGGKMIALPLVEQNKYRDSVQWLCREHSQ